MASPISSVMAEAVAHHLVRERIDRVNVGLLDRVELDVVGHLAANGAGVTAEVGELL
jgi:hypothetical protein